MKVSDLIDALEKYDPFADVVIATEHDATYFQFAIKEHEGRGVTKGQSSVVALAVTGEVSQYFITVEE
jgi:hypothetical protein